MLLRSTHCRRGVVRPAALAVATGGLALFLLTLPAPSLSLATPQQASTAPPQTVTPTRTWIDADGESAPFNSHEEVRDFLRSAEIVEVEEVGEGITQPRRVLLEENGVRMHAIFRDVGITEEEVRIGGRFYFEFHDRYQAEPAAYALARLLGISSIPPTVLRLLGRSGGSLQLWLEGTFTEEKRAEEALSPPNPLKWVQDQQEMWLFDNLIFNPDRHAGNILIDEDWNLWLIDHTRSFQPVRELLDPEQIHSCGRVLWERLNALTNDEIEQALGPYLESGDISALVERRGLLIEHIDGLIAQRGEEGILY